MGETTEIERGPAILGDWRFSARAKGDVTVKFISFRKFYDLTSKHPEFEADGRAGSTIP